MSAKDAVGNSAFHKIGNSKEHLVDMVVLLLFIAKPPLVFSFVPTTVLPTSKTTPVCKPLSLVSWRECVGLRSKQAQIISTSALRASPASNIIPHIPTISNPTLEKPNNQHPTLPRQFNILPAERISHSNTLILP